VRTHLPEFARLVVRICAAAMLIAVAAGCRVWRDQAPDLYRERILEHTSYNLSAAKLNNQNMHIPAHDPRAVEATFDANKQAIVAPLVPYLKTYEGREYPGIFIEANGWPLPPDGREIIFHLSVEATISPREPGRGIRPLLDDRYLAAVWWDPAERRATRFVFNSAGGGAIPAGVSESAKAIAARHDPRYRAAQEWALSSPGWLPAWYVRAEVFSKPPASEKTTVYWSFIKEDTGHNLVTLRFTISRDPQRERTIYHTVVVDVELGKVVGVHESEMYTGPMVRPGASPGRG